MLKNLKKQVYLLFFVKINKWLCGFKALFLPASLEKLSCDKPFPLYLPTYEKSGQAVHPDIIYRPDENPRFILAFTPYPFSYHEFENPSILVSSDGLRFFEEFHRINPLVPHPQYDHNNDPDIFFYEDQWCILYLESLRPEKQHLVLLSSTDRRFWSSRIINTYHLKAGDPMIVSPAFIKTDSGDYLFYVNISKAVHTIEFVPVQSGFNPDFSDEKAVDIDLKGKNPWHIDVITDGKWFYMLISCVRKEQRQNKYDLYIARSDNLYRWNMPDEIALQNAYRSTGFIVNHILFIYFSRENPRFLTWEIGVLKKDITRFFENHAPKIAMIVNSFPSLSERYLINQFTALIAQHIDFDIYAAVCSGEEKKHDAFYQGDLESRTIHLNISRKLWKRMMYAPFLFIKNFIRTPAYTLRAFSREKYVSQALNLKNLFFLDAFYKKKYDIIHCQFGKNGLTGSFLKDCHITEKLFVTFHGSDINAAPLKYGKNMYHYMFQRADIITAGTHFIMGQLIHYGCPQDKIRIIPMGVYIKPYQKEKDGTYFLSVGRLTEVKGFVYSIQAFALLAKSFSELTYYIVGNGSLYKQLEALIKVLGMEKRIFLTKEKQDTEIEKLYEGALAFIMPSICASDGSEEGQGLVIQEAESYELPVIGTNTGGIPEGVIHNKTGFLVPEKNVYALYEKMLFLVKNPELCRQFGKAGRHLVMAKYDILFLTRRMVTELYGEALKNDT